MRKISLALIAMLTAVGMQAQNHQFTKDSAEYIVGQYLRLLNIEGLPADSMLSMTTLITSPQTTDTLVMRRWYCPMQRHRIEVWDGQRLTYALYSDGKTIFRTYHPQHLLWNNISQDSYLNELAAYDFRGPLHEWRNRSAILTHNGRTSFKGQSLEVVKVESPGFYTRYYLFDPTSALLTAIIETEQTDPDYGTRPESHIEYKIEHEYAIVGEALLPSLESFMRDGILTVLTTTYSLQPINLRLFTLDTPEP